MSCCLWITEPRAWHEEAFPEYLLSQGSSPGTRQEISPWKALVLWGGKVSHKGVLLPRQSLSRIWCAPSVSMRLS